MNSGFVLGLGAALAWGVADVIVTLYARQIGFLRALLVIHGLSLIPLTALALVLGAPQGTSWTQWAAAAALGPLAVAVYAAFTERWSWVRSRSSARSRPRSAPSWCCSLCWRAKP